jgi:hypothetical protein
MVNGTPSALAYRARRRCRRLHVRPDSGIRLAVNREHPLTEVGLTFFQLSEPHLAILLISEMTNPAALV